MSCQRVIGSVVPRVEERVTHLGLAQMGHPLRGTVYFVRQMYTDCLVPSARLAKIRYSPEEVMPLVLQLYW
jgi:hypothetical protein